MSWPSFVSASWFARHRDPASPETIGTKAARLREIGELGIPVPAWIVLTTGAARAVLAPVEKQIESIVEAVPGGDAGAARDASKRIARLVQDAAWPRALRDDLRERLRELRDDSGFAVRSSAAGEDGARHSHAGQLESLLHVSREGVESAVRACWASTWSDRAILYRQARHLPSAGPAAAVIVQEMIESRVAGVAFTAHPLTGARAEVVVAGYGLGEGVVADRVESDEFVRRSPHDAWHATVRPKTRRCARRRDGEPGTEVVPVPNEMRDRPALTPEELDRLADHLVAVERAAGRPQDVEWALDGTGHLWILQARPITASPAGRPAIWDDGNIGESYPGITLPLTYSYVRRIYERVFRRALRQVGVPGKTIERASGSFGQLVGTIAGRLYLNVLDLYRLYSLVPGLEAAVRRWEDAFGVRRDEGDDGFAGPASEASGEARARARGQSIARLRTRSMLALRFLTRERAVRRLKLRMMDLFRRFERTPFEAGSFEELLETYERIERDHLDDWALVLFNDLYATYFSERLAKLCAESSRAGRPSLSAADLHERLLRGETRMESVAPLRSVIALASKARGQAEVASLLRAAIPDEEIWSEILVAPFAASFRASAEEHIRVHGCRVPDELKFEAASLHEAPWMLVPIVRNHLHLGLEPEEAVRRNREHRLSAEREYRGRFRRNPLAMMRALWTLRNARRTLADRENLALVRTRAHALLRRLFRALGDALAREGALSRAEDVFYLQIEELQGYARGRLPECGLEGIVTLRRSLYTRYRTLHPAHRILCRGSVYQSGPTWRSESAIERGTDVGPESLRGVPCSAGRVRGVARVIRAATAGERVDGDILIAPATDPGWMFLMMAAKGLIVERGSILSHAAIIGRELGIPTIVGVAGATDRIRTGDTIEMDGRTGKVWVVAAS